MTVTPRGRVRSQHVRRTGIRKETLRHLRRIHGTPGKIPAAPVHKHVLHLLNIELTQAAIARAAGVSEHAIHRIINGQQNIHPNVARAILAVTHHPHPRRYACLAVGARRRMQALTRNGRSIRWQLTQLDRSTGLWWRLQGPRTAYDNWAAVRDLYDQWWDKPGGNQRAINEAIKAGWAPAAAWEDDTIDDPLAKPDLGRKAPDRLRFDRVVVDRLVAGKEVGYASPLEREAAIERLARDRIPHREMARRLGVHPRTIERRTPGTAEAA